MATFGRRRALGDELGDQMHRHQGTEKTPDRPRAG